MKIKNKKGHRSRILILLIGCIFSVAIGFHLYAVLSKRQQEDIEKVSTIYAERTESLINSIFHKTDVLATVVKLQNGDISEETFNTVAHLVYEENAGIRGIQYMPGAVVTYSYPLEGNEGVMGKNFLEIPDRKKDVLLAIDTKKIALSGPYELIQGGLGVVARNPIFLTDANGNEYFWGFSAIVLDLPDALSDAQLDRLSESGYNFQLFNVNENGERIVIAGDEDMDTSKAVNSGVQVPNHEWTLAVSTKRPWAPLVAGIGTCIIGVFLTYILWKVYRLVDREREAVAAKNEFFSNISHDMRTPLNAVLGYTQLARDETLTMPEKDAYLAKIESSGNLLLELINDTLMLSKGSCGKIQLHPEPCSVTAVGKAILAPVTVLAQKKEIALIVDVDQWQNRTVMMDRLYVEKIILNLLTNAVKYTPAGGHVWVSVKDLPSDASQAKVSIVIKDDGIGMSKDFQAHMFEPFMQENQHGYESNGTGLGLAIVKQSVDLLHGTIKINSTEGKGTEVIVELAFPLAAKKEEQMHVEESVSEEDHISGRRILVCEDNALNREIVVTMLKHHQVNVATALNGQEGVDCFAESSPHEFDAVLMDLRMPVMDGLCAARKILAMDREDAKTIPIIAMTADVFAEDIQKCIDAGMNGHIAKPIDPNTMFDTLNQLLK